MRSSRRINGTRRLDWSVRDLSSQRTQLVSWCISKLTTCGLRQGDAAPGVAL